MISDSKFSDTKSGALQRACKNSPLTSRLMAQCNMSLSSSMSLRRLPGLSFYLALALNIFSADLALARPAGPLRKMLTESRSGSQPSQSQNTKSSVRINKDLNYGKDQLQRLDIYSPASTQSGSPLPVVFYVHGGGWMRGDKFADKNRGQVFACHGIIFVSVDYRLAPQVKHPDQILDIAEAFSWVRKNIAAYGGDPDCIFLMGHSAGAHLVDLLATNDRFLATKNLSLQNIKGVISLDTASLNLIDMMHATSFEARFVSRRIEQAFGRDDSTLADASPELNVRQGKNYPPFLLYCGSKRATGTSEQQKFVHALQEAGTPVELKLVPLSHREINQQSSDTNSDEFPQILKFIERYKGAHRTSPP